MKKKTIIATLFAIIILGYGNIVRAMDGTFPNDAKFTRGVKNTCYYVDSTASSFTSKINSGAKSWEALDNKIKNTAVSSNKGTHIDFYAKNKSADVNLTGRIKAYTTFWDSNGVNAQPSITEEPRKDYFYSEIVLSKDDFSSITFTAIAHEMGHAYGLSHRPNNEYSIMFKYLENMQVTTPQAIDNNVINYLYPNG